MNRLYLALCAVLGIAALAGLKQAGSAAVRLVTMPQRVEAARGGAMGPRSLADITVQRVTDASVASVDLGSADGIAFIFDPTCGPCNMNMWNWVDIARAAQRQGVPVYALGLAGAEEAVRYWDGLADDIVILRTDTATMTMKLGVTSTPSTLLIRGGVVERHYRGPLGESQRKMIGTFLTNTSRGGV